MKDLRTLSHVPRWAVLRVIHRQSVADHSYYVAVYASLIAKTENLMPAMHVILLEHCLYHDIAEVFTSDIPGPVKRESCNPAHLQLYEYAGLWSRGLGFAARDDVSPFLQSLCTICNLLDEVCYITGEIRLGNMEAEVALTFSLNRLAKVMANIILTPETTKLIMSIIQSENADQNLPNEPANKE